MATCYLIAIGGTGARVLTSLYHLCAAGAFQRSDFNFKILCVDSDASNGNIEELKITMEKYNALNNVLHIFPEINTAGKGGFWSPQPRPSESMSEIVHKSDFSDNGKKLMDLLYTYAEQNQPLPRGYYGHTVIGSYFIHKEIVDSDGEYTRVWKEFIGNIDANKDKVFIIGSLFGGTGASGIPTISRIIHDNNPKVKIGAMLVMQYFDIAKKINDNNNNGIGKIDSSLFIPKIRSALNFYGGQGFDKVFETMYFIGESEGKFMMVKNNNGGPEQKNKANHIEALAAAAVLDFMLDEDDEYSVKFYDESMTDEDRLNGVYPGRNIYECLVRFFMFASLHTRYFRPAIDRMADGDEISEGWAKAIKPQKEHSDLFVEYAKRFMEWIYEVSIATNNDGEFETIYSGKNEAGESEVKWLHAIDASGGKLYTILYYPDELDSQTTRTGLIHRVDVHKFAYSALDCIESASYSSKLRPKSASNIIVALTVAPAEDEESRNDMVRLFRAVYNNCIN